MKRLSAIASLLCLHVYVLHAFTVNLLFIIIRWIFDLLNVLFVVQWKDEIYLSPLSSFENNIFRNL